MKKNVNILSSTREFAIFIMISALRNTFKGQKDCITNMKEKN